MLGLKYEVRYQQQAEPVVLVKLQNGHALELAVSDWLANPVYSKAHIPEKIAYFQKADNPFISEENLPVLFGPAELAFNAQKMTLKADLFSSVFFMLSRWEEALADQGQKDGHGRFPAAASLAGRMGFLHRPVVNEYAEMLWNMLKYAGINQERRQQHFSMLVTHDIDNPLKWRGPHTLLRTLGGDLLKRRSIALAARSWSSYRDTQKRAEKDPYDTFDYLMDCSERHGVQSHFFFLCGGRTAYDKDALPPSHPFVKKTLMKITDRGHVIGFHPSYAAMNDRKLFNDELKALQKEAPQPVVCGRQHYLRFEVPATWQLWEKASLQWDSSMGYPEVPGFRCGICRGFPVFDISSRKMLQLQERPLTLMEVSLMRYQNQSAEDFLKTASQLIQTVRKYRGEFVLLWHNSTFSFSELPQAKAIYEKILRMGSEH